MRIAVIGTGYVGLVAGACFADTGNTVYCVDKDADKIARLKKGEIPIYEPGLEVLVKRGQAEKRLFFVTAITEAVSKSEIVVMAVNTPAGANGEADLSFLRAAIEEVARAMSGYRLIINKSTVPIGTHRIVAHWLKSLSKFPFDVASNPEFLKEGSAVDDFLKPDRVIVGTDKEEVYQKLADLYAPFVKQGNPILKMDPTSAEITKYACNSFLATRISFINELSVLSEKVGGDIEMVRRGMASDVRIGKHFLYPGVGYGGSCFPKDIKALLVSAKKNDVNLGIVTAVEEANEKQKKFLPAKVAEHFKGAVSGKTFAMWGLSFKPNTDDMREAPSLVIIAELIKAGAKIKVFDPVAMESAKKIIGTKVEYSANSYAALEGAEALLVVTEWNEFRTPDFDKVKSTLKSPVIFDGRNLYRPDQMTKMGFKYYSIGRKSA